MNIPSFIDTSFVDKDGNLTPVWKNIMMELMSQIQTNYNNEGIRVPHQTTANVTKLSNAKSEGSLVYDKDAKKLYANINGVNKEFKFI